MNTKLLTVTLLAIVFFLALRGPRNEFDIDMAEQLLESRTVQRVELSDATDPPAYRAGPRAALFFERTGMHGPIRGVILVENDRIVDLRILHSHEGLGADPLDSPEFLQSFRGRPAKSPLTVDAVSGATISSQAVTDAVNVRLRQWESFNQQETVNLPRE